MGAVKRTHPLSVLRRRSKRTIERQFQRNHSVSARRNFGKYLKLIEYTILNGTSEMTPKGINAELEDEPKIDYEAIAWDREVDEARGK